MIDFPTVYNVAVLLACAILFFVGLYAIFRSGRLGALADVGLRLLDELVYRLQTARADYKAGRRE